MNILGIIGKRGSIIAPIGVTFVVRRPATGAPYAEATSWHVAGASKAANWSAGAETAESWHAGAVQAQEIH